MQLEKWRASWRYAWAPALDDRELETLAEGLAWDDARIQTGNTVLPFGGSCSSVAAQCACPLAYAIWMRAGRPLRSFLLSQLWDERHEEAQRHGHGRASTFALLAWIDTEDWQAVRAGLLGECSRELARRGAGDPEDGAIDLDGVERLVG